MKHKIRTQWWDEPGFELDAQDPNWHAHPAQEPRTFEKLRANLLAKVLGETDLLALHQPLKVAANEAAALSWTTAFPVLVFPGLLAEKIQQAKQQVQRQQGITARSQNLMECAL